MINKFKKIFLMIFIASSFTQETSSVFTGSFGSVTLGDEIYNHFSLRPEISAGNLGLGLDFYFYFDDEGNLHRDNWNFSDSENSFKTIVDKIHYIRWGTPIDDFYFRFGALPKISLGYGSLVNNYSNVTDYPNYRRKGFTFNYKFSKVLFKFVHSDFKEFKSPSLLALSVDFEYVDKLNLNLTLVTDGNQQKGLVDSDDDGYPDYMDDFPYDDMNWNQDVLDLAELNDPSSDLYCACDPGCNLNANANCHDLRAAYQTRIDRRQTALDALIKKKDEVSGMSFGLSYELTNRLSVYSEWSQLIGKTTPQTNYNSKLGSGYIPIGFKMNWDRVSFSVDYRTHDENFVFNYWNQNYDLNRIVVNTNDNLVSAFETKEQGLYKYGESKGVRLNIASSLKYFGVELSYSHMNSDLWQESLNGYKADKNNTLYLGFNIDTSNIQRVQIAEMFYQQSYVSNPFDFDPNEHTLLGYNIGIDLSDNMVLTFKGRKSYVPSIDDPNDYDSVKNTQIETQILF